MNGKPFALSCLSALVMAPAVCLAGSQLNLDLSQVTVSGISSGGYMANQFHISHGEWVSGVGVIAAGPYGCSEGNLLKALANCTGKEDGKIDENGLMQSIQEKAGNKKVASLDSFKDDKVWVLSGSLDKKVLPKVTQALVNQYASLVNPEHLLFINDKPFAHHFPSISSGTDCAVSEAPYIGNCGYDAAGEMLNHLYSDLAAPPSSLSSKVTAFSQESAGEYADTLADQGYLYVPASCKEGNQCRLHVNFHGCNQNAQALGEDYVTLNGINRWADSNHMVVLYPQTKNSALMPLNPQGCWDWWGYSGDEYDTKEGKQIKAVVNVIHALSTIVETGE